MELKKHIEDLKFVVGTVSTRNELIALLELKKYELVKEAFENVSDKG